MKRTVTIKNVLTVYWKQWMRFILLHEIRKLLMRILKNVMCDMRHMLYYFHFFYRCTSYVVFVELFLLFRKWSVFETAVFLNVHLLIWSFSKLQKISFENDFYNFIFIHIFKFYAKWVDTTDYGLVLPLLSGERSTFILFYPHPIRQTHQIFSSWYLHQVRGSTPSSSQSMSLLHMWVNLFFSL